MPVSPSVPPSGGREEGEEGTTVILAQDLHSFIPDQEAEL